MKIHGEEGFMIKEKMLKQAVSVINEFDAVLITALQSIYRLIVALTEKSLQELDESGMTTKECILNVCNVASKIESMVTIASLYDTKRIDHGKDKYNCGKNKKTLHMQGFLVSVHFIFSGGSYVSPSADTVSDRLPHQLHISCVIVVDQVIQFRPLVHIRRFAPLDLRAVDRKDAAIPQSSIHAAGVHIITTEKHIHEFFLFCLFTTQPS